jgi:hypothetical protein
MGLIFGMPKLMENSKSMAHLVSDSPILTYIQWTLK